MKANLQEQLEVSLPDGFTVRGAVLGDVDDALKLFNRWSQSVIHEDEITDAVAIRTEWVSPGFDPAEDEPRGRDDEKVDDHDRHPDR